MDFRGAVERGLDIRHDVPATHAVEESLAAQQLRRLLHGPAEHHGSAGFVKTLGKLLDGVNAGSIRSQQKSQTP
jgi:hypothetical protein